MIGREIQKGEPLYDFIYKYEYDLSKGVKEDYRTRFIYISDKPELEDNELLKMKIKSHEQAKLSAAVSVLDRESQSKFWNAFEANLHLV